MSTTPMISAAEFPPPTTEVYADRSTGLIIFGIILVLVGLFCSLMIPLSLLGVFLARKSSGAMPAGTYVMSISIYLLSAVIAIALGGGSIRKRRWGRNLTLIASWIWLIYGAISLVMMTAIVPASFLAGMRAAAAQSPQAQPLPAGIMAVILTVMIAIAAIFLVVLPIIFVVFYGRKDVEETCKRLDPSPSWTEQAPLPVLAASIICAFGAFYSLQASFAVPLFPFFGKYITGLPATGLFLLLAGLDGFLTFSLFKKQLVGWWVAVLALFMRVVALALTILRGNLFDAYSRIGYSNRQLQMMQSTGLYRNGGVMWFGLIFLFLYLGYLIWIKRYFVDAPVPSPTADIPASI